MAKAKFYFLVTLVLMVISLILYCKYEGDVWLIPVIAAGICMKDVITYVLGLKK